MAELINMPKLGFDMREGQLINWLKKPGDSIEQGDILAEIESDKATVEVEAFTAGTLLQLLVEVGDWVPIGAPIAVVGEEGEAVDLAALGADAAPAEEAAPVEEAAPAVEAAPAAPVPAPAVKAPDAEGLPDGFRASPLARKVAEERGINLALISGTGPQGRIVKADVESFTPPSVEVVPVVGEPVVYLPTAAGPDDEELPLPRMRTRIGQRMVEAKHQVPHFYVTTSVDMGPALAMRKDINKRLEAEGIKVSVNDMIVKAAALALKQYPNINSSFNGETVIRRGHINVGIAVAIENGLINVVSKDADKATLSAMAIKNREMISRAREGKVKPEDVEGETFAVSNLGPWDVDHFIAIINPPAAAILALGTAQKVPVVKTDDTLGIGWQMKATLSADHRVTDGAEAAAFLQLIKQILEDPIRLLV